MRTRSRSGMALLCSGAVLAFAACSHKEAPPAATRAVAPAATAPKQAEPAPSRLGGAFSFLMVLIDAQPEEGKAPLQVQFTVDRPPDSGQPPVKYHWDFGDGTKSSEENPKHTYTKPGSYDVTLEAVDAGGDEDDDELTIVVRGEGEAK